jgi:hypothetical protein
LLQTGYIFDLFLWFVAFLFFIDVLVHFSFWVELSALLTRASIAWLPIEMGLLVRGQIRWLSESLGAIGKRANVWLLPCVGAEVSPEVEIERETLLTYVAFIRLFAGMHELVSL